MDTSLRQDINAHCQALTRTHALNLVQERYDPKYFGDSLAVLENSEVRLRFTRDRGQVFLDIASQADPEAWWQLDEVYGVFISPIRSSVGDNDPVIETRPPRDLALICSWLEASFTELTLVFSLPQYFKTKQALLQLQDARKEEYFKRHEKDV